jgi:hypothetical protein
MDTIDQLKVFNMLPLTAEGKRELSRLILQTVHDAEPSSDMPVAVQPSDSKQPRQ